MDFARHEALLRKPAKDGVAQRVHLEGAAARGSAHAIAALQGPPLPDSIEYLWDWAVALHGRSGVGMSGVNPLTYATIDEWSRLMQIDVQPHEVETLMRLDAVLCNPEVGAEA